MAKVKNLKVVTKAVKMYGVRVERLVEDEIMRQTSNIEHESTQRKPNGIKVDKYVSKLSGIVMAGAFGDDKLAAYVEFGTGVHASYLLQLYPQEVKDLAMKYYVNGQGRLFSQPYLIPAYLRYRKEFLKNIKKGIKKLDL